jgi:hypothetical protein
MQFELLRILLILLFVAGSAFTLLLFLAVVVGGTRDLACHWRDRIEESRRSHGLCMRCGYDLRGSPARCPECGRAASAGDPHELPMLRSTSA